MSRGEGAGRGGGGEASGPGMVRQGTPSEEGTNQVQSLEYSSLGIGGPPSYAVSLTLVEWIGVFSSVLESK